MSEKLKWQSVLNAKKSSFGARNTETAGQNYIFVNDKNSWNSAKTALFSGFEFFISKNTVKVGFGYRFWLQKQQLFSAYEFFISEKIKWKSILAAKQTVFWREIRQLLAKIVFLWTVDIKLMKFFENSGFSGRNTVKIFSPNPAFTSLFGLCFVHFHYVWFLKQMYRREICFGKIAATIAQKSNTKNKILEENASKIVLFEKNIFFNFCSIFVKKKNNTSLSAACIENW